MKNPLSINDLIKDGYEEIKDISILEKKEYSEFATYCYIYKHKDKCLYFEPYGWCDDDYIFYNEELRLYVIDNYEYFSKKEKEEYNLIRKEILKNN